MDRCALQGEPMQSEQTQLLSPLRISKRKLALLSGSGEKGKDFLSTGRSIASARCLLATDLHLLGDSLPAFLSTIEEDEDDERGWDVLDLVL